MFKKLALLAVVALVLALTLPATASAFYWRPYDGSTYLCSGGGWSSLVFDLNPVNPTFYRGIVYLNGDNKKFDLAKPYNHHGGTSWEATFPLDGLQCKDMFVSYGAVSLSFQQCSDGKTRYCTLY